MKVTFRTVNIKLFLQWLLSSKAVPGMDGRPVNISK
jgi:hypothetical protein